MYNMNRRLIKYVHAYVQKLTPIIISYIYIYVPTVFVHINPMPIHKHLN